MPTANYVVLAYYHLTAIADPLAEVERHRRFLQGWDVSCRIYISAQGINGQMSASPNSAAAYMEWLRSDPRFAKTPFKRQTAAAHAFPRVTVKQRPLVALGRSVSLQHVGEYLSPRQWRQMLTECQEECLVLDVRNAYESRLGHFIGAVRPPLRYFRHFPAYIEQLQQYRQKKMMLYCTGGIRCEFYSALLKEVGFERVYQLRGGVIGYGQAEGNRCWKGKLFVFDARLAVDVAAAEGAVISHCHHCAAPCSSYHNCANLSCNALFLGCPSCLIAAQGCCCSCR